MKSATTNTADPSASTTHPLGVVARLRRAVIDLDGLTREEARRRIQSKPGLFASLSPEAREELRGYDGPENMGPSPFRR